jgi:5-hydroxyisourate hydrolase
VSRPTAQSPITSHVLDIARGVPAAGVPITLEIERDGEWHRLGAGVTDDDGRLKTLMFADAVLERRRYRLTFDTEAYFGAIGVAAFYPSVQIVFQVRLPDQHHHVPLLLSPFGYSTYRGS